MAFSMSEHDDFYDIHCIVVILSCSLETVTLCRNPRSLCGCEGEHHQEYHSSKAITFFVAPSRLN